MKEIDLKLIQEVYRMVKEKSYSFDRKTLIETRMFFHEDQTVEILEADFKDELIANGYSFVDKNITVDSLSDWRKEVLSKGTPKTNFIALREMLEEVDDPLGALLEFKKILENLELKAECKFKKVRNNHKGKYYYYLIFEDFDIVEVQSEPSLYYSQDVQGDLITEIYNQIDKSKILKELMFVFDSDNEEEVDKYLDSFENQNDFSIKVQAAIKENIFKKYGFDRINLSKVIKNVFGVESDSFKDYFILNTALVKLDSNEVVLFENQELSDSDFLVDLSESLLGFDDDFILNFLSNKNKKDTLESLKESLKKKLKRRLLDLILSHSMQKSIENGTFQIHPNT
jgi:hypothetical protein